MRSGGHKTLPYVARSIVADGDAAPRPVAHAHMRATHFWSAPIVFSRSVSHDSARRYLMMSDQSTNDFEGREGVSGDAQPTQPPQPPTGESEQTTGASGAEGAATGAKVGADDFRDALSNLSSALDRFGRAAEARARQEWAQGKPE